MSEIAVDTPWPPPAAPPDEPTADLSAGSVGLAFGLVIGAGAATMVGAGLAFCVKATNYKVLAAALGVSAGVMLYVSFVEIFTAKSIQGFLDAGYSDSRSYQYATLSFFGGMLLTWVLDHCCHGLIKFASWLEQRAGRRRAMRDQQDSSTEGAEMSDPEVAGSADADSGGQQTGAGKPGVSVSMKSVDSQTHLQTIDSHTNLIKPSALIRQQESDLAAHTGKAGAAGFGDSADAKQQLGGSDLSTTDDSGAALCHRCQSDLRTAGDRAEVPGDAGEAIGQVLCKDTHTSMKKMGLLTVLAITMHNVPEGLATFLGALADPTAGVAIAVAIALHNIPEGMVVAMPIYYATGSRWKAFFWASMSGLAEPIGGLIGYLALRGSDMSPLAYALLFGIVAGIMVWISIRELIPTALRYDPQDRFTTLGVLFGFAVMAASLMLFTI